MFDIQLLLNKNKLNKKYKIKLFDKKYIYTIYDTTLDFKEILRFINFTKSLTINLPIIIELRNVDIADKLCYILLECICQYLIKERNMKISISLNVKKNIFIAGIAASPLNILASQNQPTKHEHYIKKFFHDVYRGHYRKLIRLEENSDGSSASKVSSEIEIFLKTFQIEQEYINDVTEVIGELIDNGLEHSDADCLIDVDITPDYTKNGDPDGIYYGVNIAILSFSETLIGDKIKQIYNQKMDESYKKLRIAYNNHNHFFSDEYTEDDFFAMSAFQNKISGRSLESNTGGTGLTHLISTLESKSDAYNCYIVSGNRILNFHRDVLKQDSSGWVGFNSEHNFIEHLPRNDVFVKSHIFLPGVAYNLNFVLKKEKNNE